MDARRSVLDAFGRSEEILKIVHLKLVAVILSVAGEALPSGLVRGPCFLRSAWVRWRDNADTASHRWAKQKEPVKGYPNRVETGSVKILGSSPRLAEGPVLSKGIRVDRDSAPRRKNVFYEGKKHLRTLRSY